MYQMYSLYFPVPSCLMISFLVSNSQMLYALMLYPNFSKLANSICSLSAQAPTLIEGFTEVLIWCHSCIPSYSLPRANSSSFPRSSIWKSDVRLFQMFAPAIACLNMVVFRALSSAASSAGGVAKI